MAVPYRPTKTKSKTKVVFVCVWFGENLLGPYQLTKTKSMNVRSNGKKTRHVLP
jgi:hypothetical protein